MAENNDLTQSLVDQNQQGVELQPPVPTNQSQQGIMKIQTSQIGKQFPSYFSEVRKAINE